MNIPVSTPTGRRTVTILARRWMGASLLSGPLRNSNSNSNSSQLILRSLNHNTCHPHRSLSTNSYYENSSCIASSSSYVDDGTIRLQDYSYHLHEESIAKYPAHPRGSSKLLRVDSQGKVFFYDHFSNYFPEFAKGAHIVFNESKVVNGRLQVLPSLEGQDDNLNDASSSIEMMILDMGSIGTNVDCIGVELKVMIRREEIPVGATFTTMPVAAATFQVVHVTGVWQEDDKSNGNGTECIVRCISTTPSLTSLGDLLNAVGTVPIPPYLGRDAEETDQEAYQNVYAASGASVAAPTAGLHFTEPLLRQIGHDNLSFLSLHVGAGTFQPVVAENARDHPMHAETFTVNVAQLRRIHKALEHGQRLLVVGTTSSRTLESLYWCGVKRILAAGRLDKDDSTKNDPVVLSLGQEEWIPLLDDPQTSHITAAQALAALLEGKKDEEYLQGSTSLMIIPRKYEFRIVDHLITNFHAPDSTLMLLVSAFLGGSGEKIRSVYEEAQNRGYKFLSYGDVCMFSRPKDD